MTPNSQSESSRDSSGDKTVPFGRLQVGQKFTNDAYTWEKVSETTAAILFVSKVGDPKVGRPMRYFPEELVKLID